MPLEWVDAMATGIKEVDDAHKELIACINRLQDAVQAGNGRREILGILDYLAFYAEQHFTHEEQCMNRYRCPAAKANRKAHGDFLLFVIRIRQSVQKDGVTWSAVMETNRELGEWFEAHIKRIDRHLRQCSAAGPFGLN
ncbi:MAG: hemerythrin family protein [Bacteroidetes bacterium]|nr:hemerythrin family protein [Bacteroidota bacterium]